MNIILLGPPATGKGTQAERMSQELGIPHISTGRMFRDMYKDGDPIGVKAHDEYWGAGHLVPDNITTKLVQTRLSKGDCQNGYILDGFPRTIDQAKSLDEFQEVQFVVNIESSEDLILKRLTARRLCSQCGAVYGLDKPPKKEGLCDKCQGSLYQRDDDTEEKIIVRLEEYKEKTAPLTAFYKEQGKLTNIDGNQSIDKVFKDIMDALK